MLESGVERGATYYDVRKAIYKVIWPNPAEFSLLSVNEAPDYLTHNKFILNGYRLGLSPLACIRSALIWTNESINIWSHVCGFFFFFVLLCTSIPYYSEEMREHLQTNTALGEWGVTCLSISLCTFMTTMFCSTTYHIFNCHSQTHYDRWLAIDLFGITVGMFGCFLTGIYFGFYCHPFWRNLWFSMTCFISFFVLIVELRPFFTFNHCYGRQAHEEKWSWWNLAIFISFGAFGLVPLTSWVILHHENHSDLVERILPEIVGFFAIMILALVIYVGKFPERLCPGMFDYVGHSHQLWHCLIVAAYFQWYRTAAAYLEYNIGHKCDPSIVS